MTLSELKFIVAVAKEKNFRRAAEKCFVSQPALSLAIKKLEEELKISLFERNRTKVKITPIGEKIINQAIIVLDEASKLKDISNKGQEQLNTPLKVGLIYSVAPYLLPLIIPVLRKKTPEMPLDVEENITKNLEVALKNGSIEAAVIALPFEIPGTECIPLYDEEFNVVVPTNHAWAKKKEIVAKDLSTEKVLLLNNEHCFSEQVVEACPELSKKSEVLQGNSLETIRNMVASNLGISVLPKTATAINYNNPLVKVIPFKKPVPFRRIAIAYRKSTVRMEAIEKFVIALKDIKSNNIKIF
ncbi:LysR family transcriptional regulator [Methylophilales bacterium MBRSG12]|uniref:LysR family transcriptional regulator n=1 Tax=Methylophilales bacterium MBRS-H7 TaxID=1623450 RepID=A0A0H4JBF9_9PROT|nr:LysR family transcriptional regulator [Methylophilales bacterium MBRSF5]AKO65812.1 LysR family transcriptional regulator [Methylophilales bacterium MBRS-H7]AKO67132.1 LysR family transcriptional regulator [Methylophilales bacterium MBRSG12]